MGYDVFISYRHVHAERVRPMVQALERRGVRVWFDETDIDDFAGITNAAAQGIAEAKAVLAYFSADYPHSRPCQWELTTAFVLAQRQGDPRRRVLVVNPEQGAGHVHPIELRDAKFLSMPAPGDEERLAALAESVAMQLARLDGHLGELEPLGAPAWHPEQRTGSSRFVGRLAEMWALHSALQASGVGLITGAVTAVAQLRGLGGVGKSLLAEEYALRFGAAYPGGVFWLRAFGDGDGSLEPGQRDAERQRQLGAFAARLDLPVADLDPDEVQNALAQWFATGGRPCLWVVDDLPSGLRAEDVSRWLAPHAAAKTLITTRSREYDALGEHTDLAVLPEMEALELLTSRRVPQDEDERAAAQVIAAELGYHPLALDVAAAAAPIETYPRFLDALREPSEDRLERLTATLRDALPNGHERSIARTLWRSIERLGEEGRDFLRLASVLAAAPLDAELVAGVFATADALDDQGAAERRLVALDQVDSLSLAEAVGARSWRVHALVSRTVTFTDAARERRDALRKTAIETLTGELTAVASTSGSPRLESLVPHARELTERAGDPGELELLGWVARYDYERGRYSSAVALWGRQYDVYQRALGHEHIDTLHALGNLAAALRAQGDLDNARVLQERELELSRRVLGREHPHTLTSLANLGETHWAQGDLDGARTLQERALELRQRVLGEVHPETANSLQNLAVTLHAQGDLIGAAALHQRAFDIFRRVLGDGHRHTLVALNGLAATLHARGRLDDARQLHEQALEVRRRVLGDEHPDTLTSLNNLAETLRAQGRLARARQLHEQALRQRQRALGEEHPHTLMSLNNLAATLRAEGDLVGARQLHEWALRLRRRTLGDEHPDTLTSLSDLAEIRAAQGDLDEARPLQQESFELHRRVLGDEHPHTLVSLHNLAGLVLDDGDLARARTLYEQSLELHERVLGDEHPNTVTALGSLANVLLVLGDLAGARRLHERALDLRRRALGDDHPHTLTSLQNLAQTLRAQGDLDAARKLERSRFT
jgi:tetratricopeptide (TPR) repeat protein